MEDNLILDSIKTGLIDYSIDSLEDLQPKLLINDYKLGSKVLGQIIKELESCKEFIFSVAFITESGITTLLNTLKKIESIGIPGKILTTDYLNFTHPKALKRLMKFSNIQIKMFNKGNFHAKGYIFKKQNENTLIVGSANLTQEALTHNKEWNIKINSLDNGQLLKETIDEFNKIWEQADILDNELLNKYEKQYNSQIRFFNDFALNQIKPNKMQIEALEALQNLRARNEDKSLLISATGTGKTYLSAFDVKQFSPKKFLFIVHRENIARKSIESFKNIMGDKNYGLLTGNSKDYNADYLFTTIQTLSKDETISKFDRSYFDYIVIDEVHRSGANSYLKVIDYFKPKFLLGMTATPERTDGFDIYKHFDYNIAHEIRLQDALEEDLLSPFHYFGVSEIEVKGEILDDNSSFAKLTSNERIKHIIDTIEFYGYQGNRPKGLIFCSKVEEALELSNKFNELGYKTIALKATRSEIEREDAIVRLETDDLEFSLDYIFSVDIFNEGIDIPSINQIIMLRPTQSAIIFVQQLGRGLRKNKGKEYVTVIDFIGNYQNNFLIPVALSGDKSFNKDNLRRFLREGNYTIPGASTISFDEISKKRIYDNINHISFSKLTLLKEEYNKIRNKLGAIPTFIDFHKFGSIDPQIIINHSKTYYHFLNKVEKDSSFHLNPQEVNFLQLISKEFLPTKRPHEMIILQEILKNGNIHINQVKTIIENKYCIVNDDESIKSAVNYLQLDFLTITERNKYRKIINFDNNVVSLNENLYKSYLYNNDFKYFIEDIITYGLIIYEKEYYISKSKSSNFSYYKKYTRKDASLLLNWDKNLSSVINGYMIRHNTCPIFVTYDKDESISDSIKYQDEFINKVTFSWMTRNKITLNSKETIQIKNAEKLGIKLHLFIKKADDEGSEHYYIGELSPIYAKETTINDNHSKKVPIVNFRFKLNQPVREDIYDYLVK